MMFKTAGQSSVMSVQVFHSTQKIKGNKAKPGNKGILEYELKNSQEAQIRFVGGVCSGSKCSGDVTYYTVSSLDMSTLYSQTVCPSSFFSTETIQSQKPLNISKITSKPDSENKISFTYQMLDHISYISVKGVYSNGEEIYYRPIEIVTVWGQLSRTSHSHKFAMIMVAICTLCGCLVCYRRYMKPSGYQALREERE